MEPKSEEIEPVRAGDELVLRGQHVADEHPAAVYLAHLARGSRRTMTGALNTMAGLLTQNRCDMRTLNWSALRYQHTAALRTMLADQYAPATANKMLAALRGVLEEAWRLGKMTAEDYRRAADVSAVRGSTLPRGRALTKIELHKLFALCAKDRTPSGRRNAAILAVSHNCGLRRSELVYLDLSDYDRKESSLTIRNGKGGKGRLAYLSTWGRNLLEEWIITRGSSPGPLFIPINRGGNPNYRHMTSEALYKLFRALAEGAGVPHFSPHDLRRTMISDLLDNGADISIVQQLAGHTNVTTTQKYDRRGERAKKAAASLLKLPLSDAPFMYERLHVCSEYWLTQ